MANIKQLDPGASPLHYFGAELRRLREKAGLTLAQVGGIVYLTGSMIGQIETAVKIPKEEHVPRLDVAVSAAGDLVRLWGLVKRQRLPYKHRRIAEIESSATRIFAFQPQLIHGLLQVEEYARAVLGVLDQDGLDGRVEAWLARQSILRNENPALYWVVLGEAALYQEIGGRKVMAKQLAHLLSYRTTKHVQIQVLPYSAGAHAGLVGAFSLFSFEDQPELVYFENLGGSEPIVNSQEFGDCSLRYDLLRAAALSVEDSAELIACVMKERYEHPGSERHPVAQVELQH